MSFAEIMSQVIAGKITQDEAKKLASELESKASNGRSGVSVSRNKSGGVYIRHPAFIERSEAKNKDYVAGINLPPNVAKVLFSDPKLFAEIAPLVLSLPAGAA